MAIEEGPLEPMIGRFSADMNPGLADTVAQVQQGLGAVTSANTQSQAESRQFIEENGAAVIDGHAPVNSPTGSLMSPGGQLLFDAGTD